MPHLSHFTKCQFLGKLFLYETMYTSIIISFLSVVGRSIQNKPFGSAKQFEVGNRYGTNPD